MPLRVADHHSLRATSTKEMVKNAFIYSSTHSYFAGVCRLLFKTLAAFISVYL